MTSPRRSSFLATSPEPSAATKEALEMSIALFGEDHPDVATIRENLGNVYFRSGRLDETARSLELVLAMRRKMLGDDSESGGAGAREHGRRLP
jgi:alkylhydroperoxidase/carboxymuconolactone decarboxylase family protein YurZ